MSGAMRGRAAAPGRGALVEVPACGEHVSADDRVQIRAEEFLAVALREQALAARRMPGAVPGVCTNCGERCLPSAVYCDADCRADHEARARVHARGGAARAVGPAMARQRSSLG